MTQEANSLIIFNQRQADLDTDKPVQSTPTDSKPLQLAVKPNEMTGAVVTPAKGFKIYSPEPNKEQFIRTGEALAKAGLTLEMAANSGRFLGYKVEATEEVDAGMLGGYRDKTWDVKTIGDMTVVWQYRVETLNLPQLAAPESNNQQLMPISEALMVSSEPERQEILEGMAVVPEEQPISVPTSSLDEEQQLAFLRIKNLKP